MAPPTPAVPAAAAAATPPAASADCGGDFLFFDAPVVVVPSPPSLLVELVFGYFLKRRRIYAYKHAQLQQKGKTPLKTIIWKPHSVFYTWDLHDKVKNTIRPDHITAPVASLTIQHHRIPVTHHVDDQPGHYQKSPPGR